ncbi:membrane-bound transcription factor site-1 protease [Apostasia shenzhenica]|uniref:Membrane-bound transcription factor site-1 protease n=1 Tax=Apostasia shenzhenica TaxID=1088818 RepID=A0A2I0BHC9_9ASPA|nr:membrane-bound transcription factor site-1 protease [Apostasia shenzhenica]
MVSAIGNDGPLYGTLNNPADQSDVIGVGGIDYSDHIASFSSRGMSTWEIPHGYGRVKPDVVAYGREIMGSKITTGCKSLSGTSVASPVVAGAVCLLVSVLPEETRKELLNPASMKQALVEGASKLSVPNMYEQGAGKLNLWNSYEILKDYKPRATIFPNILDYTECPYTWPFCRQPLYAGAMPIIFNATILNGMGVVGYVESPPTWRPLNDVSNLLSIRFTYSDVIWPWTGFLALHMQIKDEGAHFSGVIEGNITVKVYSPPHIGENRLRISECWLYLKLKVVPTPPRMKRVLWDQYHNIKYPPGYIPRDSLDVRNDILDWHGDHLHTNFHTMYNMLRDAGYFVETLGSPFTCFDANHYGTLLMVDLEDEYFREEIDKLRDDIVNGGLGLAVFAEWYNINSMVKMRFFDDNTRSWWTPVTGGANIPALNELLGPLGIAFGDRILNGDFSINGEQSHYASGTDIIKFPGGGYVHSFEFQDNSESSATQNSGISKDFSVLGFTEIGAGRVVVYGDSNCLDSSHMVTNCYWLLRKILDFTSNNVKDPVLFSDSARIGFPMHDKSRQPSRRTDVNFSIYSGVVGRELMCHHDSRFEVWGTKGYGIQLMGRNRKLPRYPTITLDREFNVTKKASESTETQYRNSGNSSYGEVVRSSFSKSMDFLGLLNHHDEVDLPLLIATQWVLPAFVAAACLVLFLSWRMRRKRRHRRKGSASGRMSNLV